MLYCCLLLLLLLPRPLPMCGRWGEEGSAGGEGGHQEQGVGGYNSSVDDSHSTIHPCMPGLASGVGNLGRSSNYGCVRASCVPLNSP